VIKIQRSGDEPGSRNKTHVEAALQERWLNCEDNNITSKLSVTSAGFCKASEEFPSPLEVDTAEHSSIEITRFALRADRKCTLASRIRFVVYSCERKSCVFIHKVIRCLTLQHQKLLNAGNRDMCITKSGPQASVDTDLQFWGCVLVSKERQLQHLNRTRNLNLRCLNIFFLQDKPHRTQSLLQPGNADNFRRERFYQIFDGPDPFLAVLQRARD